MIPYGRLPRRKQRDNFIRLRQKIRNDASVYGGQFTSPHVLNEPGRPALYNQWADAYFLGSDGLTIWNATIVTAVRAFWDVVEEMAHSRAWEVLTPEEQSAEAEMKFVPIWVNGRRMYRMEEKPELIYEKYGGLTYNAYQYKLTEEIILHEPPEILESFTTDRTYCYGTGLNIVINVDEINQVTIEEAIRRFREVGETDWLADKPVLRSELPMESAKSAFSKIRWEPNEVGLGASHGMQEIQQGHTVEGFSSGGQQGVQDSNGFGK